MILQSSSPTTMVECSFCLYQVGDISQNILISLGLTFEDIQIECFSDDNAHFCQSIQSFAL